MDHDSKQEDKAAEVQARRPVMAILTIEDDILLFRGNRENFADIINTGRDMGFIVYVLTVKNLNLSKSQLVGYSYNERDDLWYNQHFPFPDVIYNRIPLREDELLPSVRGKINACMKHPRTQLFNPTFFNKWSLFEWLRLSKTTKPFIPTTKRMLSQTGLTQLMRRYNYLYLKPVSGKAGKGIMTIKVLPEKSLPYRLRIQMDKKSVTYNCATIPKLWTRIRKQSMGDAYIIQQGISLATVNERRFDLRALIQKNQRGQWDITGVGARVAGTTSITTHVPRGGSIEDPEKLLVQSFGEDEARKIMIKAKNTSLLIAKQIERGSGQELGEMSMDLGVDHTGNVWFFEANAKPMKFDEPHIRKKSLERIFHYGLYLYGRKKTKIGGA
ncbi:YheC/D-like protein [Paenibacillus cellulosilyticus]|uniref:YheC/D-like protein n=1 Tax=Paenibacillus cellulosilyticus TaxID=375489 RepID=A0A2V2YE59_9BACL|nr:YheC/YheD family protein [Paenibacillus cellulosilyticus]PWV90567.1 YheC/D-like protein [Paenibacillus cellulosilyticus]QKS46772.1 YheC/YheD family protein [Paenibacillus cellulosilyticus]